MGFWRWLHDAGVRHAIGKDRRSDLLGKLFAVDAGSYVRKKDQAGALFVPGLIAPVYSLFI
jgi:hypothetical protein